MRGKKCKCAALGKPAAHLGITEMYQALSGYAETILVRALDQRTNAPTRLSPKNNDNAEKLGSAVAVVGNTSVPVSKLPRVAGVLRTKVSAPSVRLMEYMLVPEKP